MTTPARSGRRFDSKTQNNSSIPADHGNDLPGFPWCEPQGHPSWRGWVTGLLSCAVLSAIAPYAEYIVRVKLSLNLLPALSVFLLIALILVFNLGLANYRAWLRFSRQDLALIFAMTMLINPLTTNGFLSYLTSAQLGAFYYAKPENRWAEILHPLIPERLAPRDPPENIEGPRPVAWFFSGIPENESIPWGHLLGPYAAWCIALILLMAMFFALSGLLYRHWSRSEQLPFPLAEIPETIMGGPFHRPVRKPFYLNKLAWLGVGIVFLLHLYNGMGDYFKPWAPIALRIMHIDSTYLVESPWRHLHPMRFNIYPSVIGILYLISLEVSFSLWFFYLVVLKACVLVAVLYFGMGQNHHYFSGISGPQSIFIGQGTGACLAMVLVGFYLARHTLLKSLREAFGREEHLEEQNMLSSRALWLLLLFGFIGSIGWLCWAGVSWLWAFLAVSILLLSATGITRLVSEGGVFWLQMLIGPAELLGSMLSPVALGKTNFVLLNLWNRAMVFDWYRSLPMINIMGALHLGERTRLKAKHLLLGLSLALLVTFTVGYYSFNKTLYEHPLGAQAADWSLNVYPQQNFSRLATTVQQIDAYERKKEEYAVQGLSVPDVYIPDAARTDKYLKYAMLTGAAVMVLFMFLRTRLFWWPHPIGYVMWMCAHPMHQMWFTYFLGWFCKFAIVRFAGEKKYLEYRPLFIGFVVGEACATFLWLVLSWFNDQPMNYPMFYN